MLMTEDFNFHLQSITKYLEPMELKRALSNDLLTHSLGSQLNKISSNQPKIFSKC